MSKVKKSTFGSKESEKVIDLSPGPKYSLISEWSEKKDKYGNRKGRNLFKSTSNLRPQNIYH